MVYSNLNENGKTIMEQYCPDLCKLFDILSHGTTGNHTAKKILEYLLGERIKICKDRTLFSKYATHGFEGMENAFKLMGIRLPSFTDIPTLQNISMFKSSVMVTHKCEKTDHCNKDLIIHTYQETYDVHHGTIIVEDNKSKTMIEKIMNSTVDPLISHNCPTCGFKAKKHYDQFEAPLMIFCKSQPNCRGKSRTSLPDTIDVSGFSYTLSGCVYGNGHHFITMARDFGNGRVYICDGMENNAKYVELPQSSPKFPPKFGSMIIDTVFYIRSEYTIPQSK